MLSIEHDTDKIDRFKFNVPYNCVEIEFGESNDVLPRLDWDVRSIIWLDYDGKLTQSVLTDVNFVCTNASAGSLLVVSVNVHPDTTDMHIESDKLFEKRSNQFEERIGKENMPLDIQGKDFSGWNFSGLCLRVLRNTIVESLSNRNGPREEENKVIFSQLFNFEYRDGARMLTFGGMLIEKSQIALFASCDFSNLTFVRSESDEPYRIEVPKLTFKEIRHLDSQLPLASTAELKGDAIPDPDLDKYEKIYRYFPAFTEAEI